MPIYEYKCEDCSATFEELLLTRSAEYEVVCKSCGSGNVTKLMSGAAVHSAGGSDMPDCAAMCDRPASSCCGGACGGHHGGF